MKNDKLVIVESPTKAKTIAKFLGKGHKVLSSFGHIRDLPKKELGVDVENGFKPKYVIPTKSKKIASELKKAASTAKEVYFASDEDREGEAIAWHLKELLKLGDDKTKRISFHEITKEAILKAMEKPREIDMRRVDAQQARRVLDRLVGYKLSPFLWKKVARGLSAGRVQSVIVRLIVEREREIEAFKPQEYWSIEARLKNKGGDAELLAKLMKKDGETLDKFAIGNEKDATAIVQELEESAWSITNIERKRSKRTPPAPFTTSTLQQDAINKLGFSAKQTMMLAQQLYEGVELGSEGATGLITYMRTDSVTISEKFVQETRDYLTDKFGTDSIPAKPRKHKTKSKRAQEAHEAVRPTSAMRTPDELAPHLDSRQHKLYDLIWRRAIASQMIDAELETVSINIDAVKEGTPTYTFRTTGSTIKEKGFLNVYETDMKEVILPELEEGADLDPEEVTPKQHFTEPPPRFTEATLVKTLEENGIGRPSTYAPTISTVSDRGYVEKDNKKLKPTELAMLVNDLLVKHFTEIVDYKFTARMEDDLDDIAEGEKEWVPVIEAFYSPFEKNLAKKDKEVSKKELTEQETDETCEKCEKPMIMKIGRYGKFLACTGFPTCRFTKAVDGSDSPENQPDLSNEKCPECKAPMMMKRSRFGQFLSCSR
ncbi:type I DNA topoisomerase, partial [Patescibacteria group bacterium]